MEGHTLVELEIISNNEIVLISFKNVFPHNLVNFQQNLAQKYSWLIGIHVRISLLQMKE